MTGSVVQETAVGAADYGGASAEAIQHHYDLDNDFYALWLDPTRTYSCALWEGEDDTLEAAQLRKLDYIAEGARAPGARRVLDVGCGWGGMLRRLVDHHGVGHAVGLTLSQAQADFVAEWGDDRLDVRLENWADHEPSEPYDAIVTIGAFEHFADFGMPRPERVDAYRGFFERAFEWLPPRGRMSVQTIVKGSNGRLDRRTARDMLWVVDRIFPESQIPWASEVLEAGEKHFDVVSMRGDADHYSRTCAEWLARLRASRAQAVEIVREEAVADYERYLDAFVRAFANRHVSLARIVFERI
jgi:cyclopropane-fatty-acyl-phospholipid synthase